MKKMKVWSTVLATGVALTTLAACSGGSNSTTASSSEEKADKSQELVIYSNSVSNGRGDWLTAKAKEAGFNIKMVDIPGAQLADRVIAEKNNAVADMVFGIGAVDSNKIRDQKLLVQYKPKWLDKNIIICNELAPSIKCLTDYKETNNQDEYIKNYTEDILSKYKSEDIIKLLESKTKIKDVVNNSNIHIALCCYENPTDFCHRHLLADFLEKENIMVRELDDKAIEDIKNKLVDKENINSIGLDINKTVCFTGRRPKYLFGYNDDKSYLKLMSYMYDIVKNVYNKGYRNFVTGGAQGFDQLMFRVVNKLKKDNPDTNIKNILYLPCKEQSSKWGREGLFGSDNYDKMLKAADDIYYVSDTYTNTCLMDRNRAMIDNSSLVIALYDDENWYNEKRIRNTSGTLNALNYAKDNDKHIYQVSFNEKDILNTLQFSEIFDFFKKEFPTDEDLDNKNPFKEDNYEKE